IDGSIHDGGICRPWLAATNLLRSRQFLQLRVEHLERHGADHQFAIHAVRSVPPPRGAGLPPPGLQLLTYFAPGSSFSFASNIWNGMAPTTSSPSTPLPTLLPTMNVGVPLAPIFMASSTSVCTGSLYLPLSIQARKAPVSIFREAAKPTMCSISSEFGLAPMVSRSSQNLPCSPAQRAAMAARMALGWKSSGMSLLKKRTFPVSM